MPVTVTLEPFGDDVRDAYLRLLPAHEQAVARGKLEWKFRRNPHGGGRIAIARDDDGVLLGLNAFQAATVRRGGGALDAYQSMDTIVTPQARGQGVFSRLIAGFYEQADADLLYGFPNASSSPHFFGKAGWSLVGPVPMLFRPLRTGLFARRLSGHLPDLPLPRPRRRAAYDVVERFEAEDGERWRRFSRSLGCAVDRTADWLDWRLVDHPTERYTILKSPDGSWVATTVTDKHGGRVGYLMEAIGEEATLADLIATAIRRMADEGAEVVFAWSFPWSPNHRAHRRGGLFPLPARVRPIHLNFGGRVLGPDTPPIASADWYVSYLDSDTV